MCCCLIVLVLSIDYHCYQVKISKHIKSTKSFGKEKKVDSSFKKSNSKQDPGDDVKYSQKYSVSIKAPNFKCKK